METVLFSGVPFGHAGPVPPRLERTSKLPLVMALALGLVIAALLYVFNPADGGFYPVCAFHQATGWLCPGCGGLRAMHQLLHGHVPAAFYLNPALVCGLPFVAVIAVKWISLELKGEPVPLTLKPIWLWTGFAVLLLFTILRNLPLASTYGFVR